MTVDDVKRRVEAINAVRFDAEMAHSMEDELHWDVLGVIALGAENARDLANAAMGTREIEFERWCA